MINIDVFSKSESKVESNIDEQKIKEYVSQNVQFDLISGLSDSDYILEISKFVKEYSLKNNKPLSADYIEKLSTQISYENRGYGIIQPLLNDKSITEISIINYKTIFVERNGRIEKTNLSFGSEEELQQIAGRMANESNRQVNLSNPICDTRLKNGSRVNIVFGGVAVKGTTVSIRKFPDKVRELNELVGFGSLNQDMANFLKIAVELKKNIIISGGTGTGKTSLLNSVCFFIADSEAIITIEDTAEIRIPHENWRQLETKTATTDSVNEINQQSLVKTSLRMRPDRIILGEVRDSTAINMLGAMNSGHEGSMCTLHADNSRGALKKLEQYYMEGGTGTPLSVIKDKISETIDIVVQLKRFSTGERKVIEIMEVQGLESDTYVLNPLFVYDTKNEIDFNGKVVGRFLKKGTPSFINGDISETHKNRLKLIFGV